MTQAEHDQGRAELRAGRDQARRPRGAVLRRLTSGALYGANGAERRAFWQAFSLIAGLMVAICLVNVLTVMHDRAAGGHPIAAWEPAVWEYSSGLCILVCVLVLFPPITWAARRWPRWGLLITVGALPVASFLHVSGMVLARHLVYAAIGDHYAFRLQDFPYEFRKDAVTYALLAVVLWLWRRSAAARAASTPQPAQPAAPSAFDIRDGARTLRVRVEEIVCVSAAGNYVEFALLDGRKPLMRSTLAAIEASLAPLGFVRTHRSWLVNAARVRTIAPEGSGDFALDLEGGGQAPVSRRFPEALARLRSGSGGPG